MIFQADVPPMINGLAISKLVNTLFQTMGNSNGKFLMIKKEPRLRSNKWVSIWNREERWSRILIFMTEFFANCLRAESTGFLEHREYSNRAEKKEKDKRPFTFSAVPWIIPLSKCLSHPSRFSPQRSSVGGFYCCSAANSHPDIYPLDWFRTRSQFLVTRCSCNSAKEEFFLIEKRNKIIRTTKAHRHSCL